MIPTGLDATLVLLRHGESEFIVEGRFQGQAETPLSEAGIRQAELAGARLARPHDPPSLPVPTGPPLEIVHSPLARAAQTAEAAATAMARPDGFGISSSTSPLPAGRRRVPNRAGVVKVAQTPRSAQRGGTVTSAA